MKKMQKLNPMGSLDKDRCFCTFPQQLNLRTYQEVGIETSRSGYSNAVAFL